MKEKTLPAGVCEGCLCSIVRTSDLMDNWGLGRADGRSSYKNSQKGAIPGRIKWKGMKNRTWERISVLFQDVGFTPNFTQKQGLVRTPDELNGGSKFEALNFVVVETNPSYLMIKHLRELFEDAFPILFVAVLQLLAVLLHLPLHHLVRYVIPTPQKSIACNSKTLEALQNSGK